MWFPPPRATGSPRSRPGYPTHSRSYHDSSYSRWESEEFTREAVFDAIRARRCYATTGKRIIVDFRIDDHWMGEEFKSRNAPHIAVKVVGTAPPRDTDWYYVRVIQQDFEMAWDPIWISRP